MKTFEQIITERTILENELRQIIPNMQYNPRIAEIKKSLAALRDECPHKFENGFCIVCERKENE